MNPIVGSSVTLQATFRETDGNLYDPDTVELNIVDPLGIGSTPAPTNESTGIWQYVLLLDTPGMWQFQFVGTTDDLIAIAEDNVCAQASIFAESSA